MSKLYAFLATVGFLMITLAINAQPTFYFSPSNQMPNPGDQITVDVLVDDFTDITSYQYSVNWNTSYLSYVSIGNFNAELGLSGGNFGTSLTGSGKLTTLWNDPLVNPQTIANGSILFTITFDVVATGPISTDVQFTGDPTAMEVTQDTGGGIMEITSLVTFNDVTIDVAGGGGGGGGGNGLTCNFSGFGMLVESDSVGTGEQVCLDFAVCNFTDILSMQYTMQFDPTLLQFDNVTNFNLQDLSGGNFGTTMAGNGFVTISWNDLLAQGVTVPNETVIYSLCFTAIGAGGSVDSVKINGNLASIEVIDINSGGNNIGLESIDGEVKITGDLNNALTVVADCLEGSPGDTVYVDVSVQNFTDVLSLQYSMGWDPDVIEFYEIQNTGALPGALNFNTDPMLVNNGKFTFLWQDPIASGVTLANNTVIYSIGYIIVGSSGESSTVAFTGDPTAIEATQNVGGNPVEVPLVTNAGCVDVTQTIDPSLFGLVLSDEQNCPGDTIEVEVSVQNFVNIVSMQYDVQWDNTHLGFIDVTGFNLSGLSAGQFNQVNANTERIAWVEPTLTPQTLPNGTVIYIMRFVVLGSMGTTSNINFLDNPPNVFEISQEPGGVIDEYNLTSGKETASCPTGNNELTVTDTLITNVLCSGDATGAIDITVTGGNGTYSYSWSPGGSTNQDISNLTVGSYTVTITSGTETLIETYTVTEATISSNSTMVSCHDDCDGAINLIISGYSGNFSFNWSNGLPAQEDQSNLCAGSYFVTITGQNGCTKIEGPIPVTQPSELSVTGNVTNEVGTMMNGAIDLTVTGGTPSYSYNWCCGLPSQADQTGLSQGNYTVTVTDANGCTVVESFLVEGGMGVDADITDVSCNGNDDGAIHLTVGGGEEPYNYEWAPPLSGNTPDQTGLLAGTYSVTITDNNGAMVISSIEVGGPDAITILQADISNETGNGCNGSIDITVTGGTEPYTYQWSNGAAWEDPSNLCKGNYNVTIEDANGCLFISGSYQVLPPPLIVANSTQEDVSCNGGDDGSVCVTVLGGCGPYELSIPTLNMQQTIVSGTACFNNLPAGPINVVIQDSGNPINVIVHPVEIDQPAPLIFGVDQIINNTNANCDNPNGAILTSVSGGVGPYSYSWSHDLNLNTADPGNLCHLAPFNPYSVTVTDDNGCTQEIIDIELNLGLFISIIDISDVCEDCDGFVNVAVTGGSAPYTFDWDGADPNNLCAGNYGVTVTDNNGITAELSNITISEPDQPLTITDNVINQPNGNNSDGSISINVTGGWGGYTYEWSTGAVTKDIGGLSVGTYVVTVTDINGCQAFKSWDLTSMGLILEFIIQAPLCHGDSNGLIEVFVTNGSGEYEYSWSHDSSNQTSLAFGLPGGIYSVTVEDVLNSPLSGSETIPLNEPDPLVINIISVPSNGGPTGSLEADVEGGTEPYTYLWNDDDTQTTRVAERLPSGEYAVRVEDANGCVEIAQGEVELGGECFSSKEILSFNGNGKNTEFIIRCAEKFNNTLQIFNRWGQLIYETSNYDNTWSGVDQDGNNVPEGGYYYVFEYDDAGNTNRVRGSITILR